MPAALRPFACLVVALLGATSCGESAGPDGGGPITADADADPDTDTAADAEVGPDTDEPVPDARPDVDSEQRHGPLSIVAERITYLTERLCDLDGNGTLDNAVADLGSPAAALFAGGINAVLLGEPGMPVMLHFPFVEDLGALDGDDMVVVMAPGLDVDDPPDPADDFSGEESFFAFVGNTVDACGEPLFHVTGVRLEGGALSGGSGLTYAPMPGDRLPIVGSELSGTVVAGARSAAVRICGYRPVGLIDGAPDSPMTPEGLTALEALLAGGAAHGIPEIPGLSPDVDVDGDGLERFSLDGEHHIATCHDGDGTVIAGRDCWQDPRMADGISVTFELAMVSAHFAGRQPGWEGMLPGACEDPPEVSLWDPI